MLLVLFTKLVNVLLVFHINNIFLKILECVHINQIKILLK